jgi:hypothetical protein
MYFANPVAADSVARVVVFPFWFLAGLLAIWPVRRAVRETREVRELKRQSRGLCPKCGYDLRATPQRCPECGWS